MQKTRRDGGCSLNEFSVPPLPLDACTVGLREDPPAVHLVIAPLSVVTVTIGPYPCALSVRLTIAMEPPLVTFETARYADARAVSNWWVLQVLGTKLENASGVVLLFDRASRRWLSLYDVYSGDREVLNYPLESMALRGDELFARSCLRCEGSGSYGAVRFDLNTRTASRIEVLPEFADENRPNPLVEDIDTALAWKTKPCRGPFSSWSVVPHHACN